MSDLSPRDRLSLIEEGLQEILGRDVLENILMRQERAPVIYWGTATTGRPHCGYFVPIIKIAQFLRAGCKVKILLADIHGFLDNLKAPIELVQHRAEYYKYIIVSLLEAVGVCVSELEFCLGSEHQLSAKYAMDLFRLSSIVTEHDAKKAGSEVVKQVDNATLSGLIYPLMQALDEEYLGVDAQFGGIDQRKIFTLAAEQLPRIGCKARVHLMNPMVPGLAGGKMSSSDPDSKIDLLDDAKLVAKKVKKAHAVPKQSSGNGLISFVEYVLMPASALQSGGRPSFSVPRQDGEPLIFDSIDKLKGDYDADVLTPQLLKPAVTAALNSLLQPIQAAFAKSAEWQDVESKAYPITQTKKKEKKPKNLGSKFPSLSIHDGEKK